VPRRTEGRIERNVSSGTFFHFDFWTAPVSNSSLAVTKKIGLSADRNGEGTVRGQVATLMVEGTNWRLR